MVKSRLENSFPHRWLSPSTRLFQPCSFKASTRILQITVISERIIIKFNGPHTQYYFESSNDCKTFLAAFIAHQSSKNIIFMSRNKSKIFTSVCFYFFLSFCFIHCFTFILMTFFKRICLKRSQTDQFLFFILILTVLLFPAK